jgi:hypothetical protein
MDFAMRPDFMHKTAEKFMDIGAATAKQMDGGRKQFVLRTETIRGEMSDGLFLTISIAAVLYKQPCP